MACAAYALGPFSLDRDLAAGLGAVMGIAAVLFELRLRESSAGRLLGAAAGATVGLTAAFLASLILARALPAEGGTAAFLQVLAMLLFTYMGLLLGASKGGEWVPGAPSAPINTTAIAEETAAAAATVSARQAYKLLDTSVIIDGRLADIAETGFLDGTIVIPQFVLRELQMVADSADSLRRNRGRRGLDVLQRIQQMPTLVVKIVEEDFPQVREVDLKLIELAKLYGCRIVTNDFNLNKVAQLHGVGVLNINELANAMKAVVLPGEFMRVFVVKEGKEYNQGVAYLDDGTMVVVDNARRMISKTIDITVTSMLQTTAGKMIFGRFDEKLHAVHPEPKTTAAASH
ncbi:MAG: PIN domain nuclease [Bryobacterales bacterium]|nr:PIN domain nuclease [Bryobacterales bacterium]